MARRNSTNKKLTFRKAVTLDVAARDIGAKFAGRRKGKTLFLAGKRVGSSGVLFTGKELIRAKRRSLK